VGVPSIALNELPLLSTLLEGGADVIEIQDSEEEGKRCVAEIDMIND
jgi:hypothetical protein